MSKYAIRFSLLILLVLLQSVPAQEHETFAHRPGKRLEMAITARERAARDEQKADRWARERGLKTRFIDNGRVSELIAMRNGRPTYYTTFNKNAAISTAADLLHGTPPYNLDGSNVTVGVWDGGPPLATHIEFGDRVNFKDSGTTRPHATHVCGTIAASGVNVNAKGMAPAVSIDSYNWSGDEYEMTVAAASFPGEGGKIYLSNHSYGPVAGWAGGSYSGFYGLHWFGADVFEDESEQFGQYDSDAEEWDEIVYNAPYFLPFKAAGNDRNNGSPFNGFTFYYFKDWEWHLEVYDSALHPPDDGDADGGYDTIPSMGNAKNIMTVGSVRDAVEGGLRNPVKAYMEFYSGWGPADDGRIKPDIMANGYLVMSTGSDSNSAYYENRGTSMAAPNACGSAALLVDYYDKRFPGAAMRASTLKGLIIHTADDLGNAGPDYAYGWGLMNTKAAADMIGDFADGNTMRITEARLHSSTNQSDSYTIYSIGDPLRVTLCWTDPPGTSSTALDSRIPQLVNDLDLKVIGPNGTNYPYKLDYDNPTNLATALSENNIDNVEQVYIAAPLVDAYTITVDHDGVLSGGAQWYSLLISNKGPDTDEDGMTDAWEYTYFSSSTGAVAGVDSDGDGQDNLSEFISGHNPTSPLSRFTATEIIVPSEESGSPFVLSWDPVAARVYRVSWTDSLSYFGQPFTNISGNLPYPVNSFTDTVERVGDQQFYKIEVHMDQ